MFAKIIAAAGAAFLLADAATAQPFPSRTVRLLVGFGAGGGTDAIARLYATQLAPILGVPVIVENRPGASQLLAIRPLLAAAPDGHTLFVGVGSSLGQGPGARKDLPYDPVKDFSLIAMMATSAGVFYVHPSVPARTLAELVTYAKANPGKLNYGSAGLGAANHLQTEYFMQLTGTSLAHIPYKSDQDVAVETAAGTLQFSLTIAQTAVPLITAGKLVALAVTGSKRLAALPNVPTTAESPAQELRGLDAYTYYGLVGPAGVPAAVMERLNDAVNKVSAMPDVASRLRDGLMFEPAIMTQAEFRRYIERDLARWREVGKSVKLD